MIKTSLVPFVFTLAFYTTNGRIGIAGRMSSESVEFFAQNFNLSPWVTLPALVILILTFFKLHIKITILCSTIAGALVCILFQKMSITDLFRCMIMGFYSDNAQIAALMNGGGFISMLKTLAIIAISSSYFGIFRNTKLLEKIKQWAYKIAQHSTNFATVLIVSLITAALSCNQTLTTMLTYKITDELVPNREELAVYLENTAIIVSALIPWSIAATFPITTIGAPLNCIIYAVYLYAIPLWNLLVSFIYSRKYKRLKTANR